MLCSRKSYSIARSPICWRKAGQYTSGLILCQHADENLRLSPARSTTVQCDLHLDQVEVNAIGDYKTTSLAFHVNTPSVNELIVRTYLHRAVDRRSTLIFCVDLDHVANVTQAFRTAGIDARSISSISAPRARKETLDAFGRGDYPVLVNCEVLTEGTDIPVARLPAALSVPLHVF